MDRFIKLLVDDRLPKPVVRSWFDCVIQNGPSGVVNAVTVEDDDGERHVVRLIHQVMDGRHAYVIPLARDLQVDEIDQVVDQFADRQPELDFDVETSETRLRAKDDDIIPIDAQQHQALCAALAKQRHESWMRERTEAGWRYGTQFDASEKVHPMLLPWDHLPERMRVPDLNWPQQLISMLNDNGYVVVPRDELDKLLNKPTVI